MDQAPHVTLANLQVIREGVAPNGRWFLDVVFTLTYCRCPMCGADEQPTLDDSMRIEKHGRRAEISALGHRAGWICETCLQTFPRGALIPAGSEMVMPWDENE